MLEIRRAAHLEGFRIRLYFSTGEDGVVDLFEARNSSSPRCSTRLRGRMVLTSPLNSFMTRWSNKRLHTDALTRAGESPR